MIRKYELKTPNLIKNIGVVLILQGEPIIENRYLISSTISKKSIFAVAPIS